MKIPEFYLQENVFSALSNYGCLKRTLSSLSITGHSVLSLLLLLKTLYNYLDIRWEIENDIYSCFRADIINIATRVS